MGYWVRVFSTSLKLLSFAGMSLLITQAASAIDEFADLKRISRLPLTEREVESAFRTSRGDACELIPKGEPLEIRSYTSRLTNRDRRSKQRLIPSSRRELLSVGLEFSRADAADLPSLSRSQIMGYVEDHYLGIQVRVRRDLLDRKLYYHHRPIALTAKYRGAKLTQGFEPIVSGTVKDFHGLGLFVPAETRILKPEHLRTLVLVFRTPILRAGRETDSYELAIVRGKERREGLENHIFVTTKDRQELHYLREGGRPATRSRCTILGQIAVTKFDSSGLYPRTSATRSYRLATRSKFEIEDLEKFCSENELKGGFTENVSSVLDAIIDGKLR